jgi:hypothetical protein
MVLIDLPFSPWTQVTFKQSALNHDKRQVVPEVKINMAFIEAVWYK